MARAINTGRARPYILEEERTLQRHEQTIWWLRSLSAQAYADAKNALVESTGVAGDKDSIRTRYNLGTQVLDVLYEGLERVENFLDEDGVQQNVPERSRNNRAARIDWFSKLKPAWREELAGAILEGSELTETERGNSATPSASTSDGTAASAPVSETPTPTSA